MNEQDAVNVALAEAVRRIEGLHGNDVYRRAWKRAATVVKDLMVDVNTSITDKDDQISST